MRFRFDLKNDRRWVPYTVAACAAVLLYIFLNNFNVVVVALGKFIGFINPVIVGIVIAYVLNALAKLFLKTIFRRIKKYKIAWRLSVILSYVTVLLFISLLLIVLVPQLLDSIKLLGASINLFGRRISEFVEYANAFFAEHGIDITIPDLNAYTQDLTTTIISWMSGYMSEILGAMTQIGSIIFDIVISTIVSVYFLVDKSRMKAACQLFFKLILPENRYGSFIKFWSRCNKILFRFIGYDLLDGLIIGMVNALFMTIMRMPYIAIVSVVVGVTNLAPTFGPLLGGVIGAFILVLNNPWNALWFILFTLILQTVDGYILKPLMFSDSLGVPSIWVLIWAIVFGRMFGVYGVLLAIPIAAIINFVYKDYFIPYLDRRRRSLKKTE